MTAQSVKVLVVMILSDRAHPLDGVLMTHGGAE